MTSRSATVLLLAALLGVALAQNSAIAQNPATDDIIIGPTRPPVDPNTVPTDLTCPTTANANSVFLTANATHPESIYTSYLAYNAILETQKVPQPPAGCNPVINEDQVDVSSICAATVTDGFIVISNFVVRLSCGATAPVQANIRINGTADDDVSLRNFNIGAWTPATVPPTASPTAANAPSPAVAAPSKAPAPSPLILPSPSPTPPPKCRGDVRPQCQFMLTSMNTCCNNTGIVTALAYADVMFTCSADNVALPNPNCLIIDGPEDVEVRQLAGGTGFQLIYGNSTDQYSGIVSVGLNQTGQCALNITGSCQLNGTVYTTVPQVDDFEFIVQDPTARQYFNWIQSANDLDMLGSTSWLVTGQNRSGAGCRTQQQWRLPEFFYFNFYQYTGNATFGTTFNCNNSTATACTVLNAPASAPSLAAQNRP